MAGSLVVLPIENSQNPVIGAGHQWVVEYARFFNYPSLASTFPSLAPLPDSRRNRFIGTWIASSPSSSASVKLTADQSKSDFILTVTFLGKIREEHYVSKLHFSWPHVSCVSGFPSRGSRSMFVTYRDSEDQIQKFALRFSSGYEVESFADAVKKIVEGPSVDDLPDSKLAPETSPEPQVFTSDENVYRPRRDWKSMASPDLCTHQKQTSVNRKVVPSPKLTNEDFGSISAAFPPSFTSMLMSCQPVPKQEPVQPVVHEEVDLKLQVMKYLEDSSFQDILGKVERVIGEIGDGLMM